MLGTDCPGDEGSCAQVIVEADAGGDPGAPEASAEDANVEGDPPEASVDAGGMDEPTPDAAPPRDAANSELLVVDNPNFERNGGIGGDVVLASLLGKLVPIPPITIIFADLPGWYACRPLAVTSGTDFLGDAGAQLPGGSDFLSFTVNGTPVRQELKMPMLKGHTYAFEIDALNLTDNSSRLFVQVLGANDECGTGTELGRSPLLPENRLTHTCVEFTPDQNYAYLLIAPGHEGPDPSASTRLLVDTLRPVSSCPSP